MKGKIIGDGGWQSGPNSTSINVCVDNKVHLVLTSFGGSGVYKLSGKALNACDRTCAPRELELSAEVERACLDFLKERE